MADQDLIAIMDSWTPVMSAARASVGSSASKIAGRNFMNMQRGRIQWELVVKGTGLWCGSARCTSA